MFYNIYMYKHKYNKYKTKYLGLMREMGVSDSNDPDDADWYNEDNTIIEDELETPDSSEMENEENKTISKEYRRKLSRSVPMDDELDDNDTYSLTDEIEETDDSFDVGTLESSRGKLKKVDEFGSDDFVTIKKKKDADKILKLATPDDFDEFTDRYGFLDDNKTLRINWTNVTNDYMGLYINNASIRDREDTVIFKGKSYTSWLINDNSNYDYDDVLIFDQKLKSVDSKKITKPFNGKIIDPYLVDEDQIVSIRALVPSNKILLIDDLKTFDILTNKYGIVNDKNKVIMMNWDKMGKDYKGFYIDKENDFFNNRYAMAFFNGVQYKSWWSSGGIEPGVVYMFDEK